MDDAIRRDAEAAHAEIVRGALRGEPLARRIAALPFVERDAWVDVALGIPDAPPDEPLPRGAVPYLPAGVDEILAFVAAASLGPSVRFVDLGAGLGRVVLLAHLVSGAPCHGIEVQASLVERARALARALALDVGFTAADAARSELVADAFFLYAPFNGALLRAVLAQLQACAHARPIVIGAVGLELDAEPWLVRRPSPATVPTLGVWSSR